MRFYYFLTKKSIKFLGANQMKITNFYTYSHEPHILLETEKAREFFSDFFQLSLIFSVSPIFRQSSPKKIAGEPAGHTLHTPIRFFRVQHN